MPRSLYERLLEEAGNLTPLETARLAGDLLSLAGCSRENVLAFLPRLSEDERDELAGRLTSYTGEEA